MSYVWTVCLQVFITTIVLDINLYENLRRYLLTEEDLCVNGFPRPGKLPGTCLFAVDKPKATLPKEKRTCARCGKEFFMTKSGHFFNEDECIHHWGKAFPTKVGFLNLSQLLLGSSVKQTF